MNIYEKLDNDKLIFHRVCLFNFNGQFCHLPTSYSMLLAFELVMMDHLNINILSVKKVYITKM